MLWEISVASHKGLLITHIYPVWAGRGEGEGEQKDTSPCWSLREPGWWRHFMTIPYGTWSSQGQENRVRTLSYELWSALSQKWPSLVLLIAYWPEPILRPPSNCKGTENGEWALGYLMHSKSLCRSHSPKLTELLWSRAQRLNHSAWRCPQNL